MIVDHTRDTTVKVGILQKMIHFVSTTRVSTAKVVNETSLATIASVNKINPIEWITEAKRKSLILYPEQFDEGELSNRR